MFFVYAGINLVYKTRTKTMAEYMCRHHGCTHYVYVA